VTSYILSLPPYKCVSLEMKRAVKIELKQESRLDRGDRAKPFPGFGRRSSTGGKLAVFGGEPGFR
jgi:hypothetical protein